MSTIQCKILMGKNFDKFDELQVIRQNFISHIRIYMYMNILINTKSVMYPKKVMMDINWNTIVASIHQYHIGSKFRGM